MLLNLHRLLNSFYRYWYKQNKYAEPIDKTLSITLSLNEDYTVNIKLNYPDVTDASSQDIVDYAEKYAELLLYINSNALKQKLIDQIAYRKTTTNNTDEQLFLDNILIFYDVIKNELAKINGNNIKGPLIRPTSVFSVTHR